MTKNRREAIKLLGGALGTLGAASLFADENSANSAGSEAQNLNEQNSVNSTRQNSAPNPIKQNSSGDSASLYLRPPGALAERGFRSSCIKCGQCVQVCPYHSIELLDIAQGYSNGTSYIDAHERGCYLCDLFPCVLACPSGALDHATTQISDVKMGVGVLRGREACLAYKNENVNSPNF